MITPLPVRKAALASLSLCLGLSVAASLGSVGEARANSAMESLGISAANDDAMVAAMTKKEKADKAAELAATMTAMVSDPGFPASSTADLQANVEMVIYMGGFHLSSLTYSAVLKDDTYQIRSNVRTRGIVDAIVKTNAVIGAKGLIAESSLIPKVYNSDITDRNQRQLVAMTYTDEEGFNMPSDIQSFPPYNLERYPVSLSERQQSVDPMSAITRILLGASLDAENPCGGTIAVFDGRRRFNLILEYRETEEISTGRGKAWSGEALKCWIGFKRVAGYKPRKPKSSDRRDGLSEWPDIYMWLAPIKGAERTIHVPVRFEAKTRLGAVIARAIKLDTSTSDNSAAARDDRRAANTSP